MILRKIIPWLHEIGTGGEQKRVTRFLPQKSLRTTLQWLVYTAIIAITAWGLFLRIYAGGVQSFWIDESFSVNAALGILEDGTPHLTSGVSYWRGALHTYPMSFFMWLGSPTEFAARFPAMLVGAATIPVSFLLGQRIGGTAVGISTATLIAFADIEIAWSRQARMYQQLQFFTLLALYGYIIAYNRPTWRSVSLTVAAIAAATASHILGFLVAIIIVLHLSIMRLSQVRNLQDIRSLARLNYLGIAIVILVGIYVAATAQDAVSGIRSSRYDYLITYLGYLQTSFPLVLYLGTIGLLISIRHQTSETLLLFLAIGVSMYLLSFHVKLLHFRYLYFVLPVLFVGLALAFSALPELLKFSTYSWVKPCIIIAGTVLALTGSGFTIIPRVNYYLDPLSPQPNFKNAYHMVSMELQPNDIIVDAWPAVGQLYLPRPPDYWPVFSLSGMNTNHCSVADGQREIYGNALCLHSVTALQDVVKSHARGWVIVDPMAWHKLSQATRDYISGDLTLHLGDAQMGPQSDVQIYRWEPRN